MKSAHPASAGNVGCGAGAGFTVNVGWEGGGAGDLEYLAAFDHVVLPFATRHKPSVVLVSAGFDAARGDPIGGCRLTPEGYAAMTRALCCSVPSARGRVLLFLEGGYKLSVLPACVAACVGVLVECAEQAAATAPAALNEPLLAKDPRGSWCGKVSPESVLDAAFFSSGDSDTASVSEAEALDSSQVDTESDDWTEGLLPAAVQAISATKEAHRGHFLAAR